MSPITTAWLATNSPAREQPVSLATESETVSGVSKEHKPALGVRPEANVQRHDTAALSMSRDAEVTDNLVRFPGAKPRTRGRKKKTKAETYRVDYVKPSKNTWAFRVRWTEADGTEPAVYVSRVNDQSFKLITRKKVFYAAFKKQLVASYLSRAVRQSDRADASSHSAL